MTVTELIRELQRCNPEAGVILRLLDMPSTFYIGPLMATDSWGFGVKDYSKYGPDGDVYFSGRVTDVENMEDEE